MLNMKESFGQRAILTIKKILGKNIFLCDSCQFDWRGACHNRERPNVTRCSDYKKRGK
ncbi:MAG: hypothetical protein HY673_14625 [Chloroflexi bacterium]|nr:hypothetical protein [Chloroflexota bacterium]